MNQLNLSVTINEENMLLEYISASESFRLFPSALDSESGAKLFEDGKASFSWFTGN